MSTAWLSGIVGLGLLVLIGIAYGAHRLELSRIERIRRAGAHRDRFRDLAFILEVIPAKAIEGELPLLLTKAMVLHLEKALELDRSNSELRRQLGEARRLCDHVTRGGAVANRAFGGSIGDQLKNVQRGIKLLKEFILQQHRGGFLGKAAATEYIKSLHDMNLSATVDGLASQAKYSLGEGNKSLALRYYQLALNELAKSKVSGKHSSLREEVATAIKELKADKKASEEAEQELNRQLAEQINQAKS